MARRSSRGCGAWPSSCAAVPSTPAACTPGPRHATATRRWRPAGSKPCSGRTIFSTPVRLNGFAEPERLSPRAPGAIAHFDTTFSCAAVELVYSSSGFGAMPSTLADYVTDYQNTAEHNDRLYQQFREMTDSIDWLKAHRDAIEANHWGMGDRAYQAM